jgi:tetratricopeptide (TPR) repeat protein
MSELEMRIKARHFSGEKTRYEDLFLCLIQAVNSPTERIPEVIERLDRLIDSQSRWGAAYAIRASARREQGVESLDLDDFRAAIEDFNRAETLLEDSPFVLAEGLMVLTTGIELAIHLGSDEDVRRWRDRAEEVVGKLNKWPNHFRGQQMVVRYYHATGQMTLAKEAEDAFVRHGGDAIFQAIIRLRDPNDADLAKLERELRLATDDIHARLSLAFVLAVKSDEGRKEAMEIIRRLQKEDVMTPMKIIALDIPLLAGMPDEAIKMSKNLLESNHMSGEWRWWKYIAEYRANEMEEEELLRRAGPFGLSRCMANYEIAMRLLALGDREKAETYFRETRRTGIVAAWNYYLAQVVLQRMREDLLWPRWIPPNTTSTNGSPAKSG